MFITEVETMPSRTADGEAPARAPQDRARPPPSVTPVTGPGEVRAAIDRALARCRRERGLLALLCVRVERIVAADGVEPTPAQRRQVQDELAHRMVGRVRATDQVLRVSDGDACVLLHGATDEAAQRVAVRFAKSLGGAYRCADRLFDVTVRLGVATYPQDGMLADDLLRRAAGSQRF